MIGHVKWDYMHDVHVIRDTSITRIRNTTCLNIPEIFQVFDSFLSLTVIPTM